jgi:Hemerythrin HHE cation binding domain
LGLSIEYSAQNPQGGAAVVEQSLETPLDLVRLRRAELREVMNQVEKALAASAPGRVAAWTDEVAAALRQLHADFGEHVAIAEGPDGLHVDVLETAPRLHNAIKRLTAEHAQIWQDLDAVSTRIKSVESVEDVNDVRALTTSLLGRLTRHRQRGADLVFEAYQVDIGGET